MLKRYKIFFKKYDGEFIDLGFFKREDCIDAVNSFLEEKKFKSYYIRIVKKEEGVELWDVGSHVEFFYTVIEDKLNKFAKDKKIVQQFIDIE